MIKIIYSFGVPPSYEALFEKELSITEAYSKGEFEIIPFNHRKESGWPRDTSPLELDILYRKKDPALFKFYARVADLCRDADIFFVDHECIYHPDFIKELSKTVYTVYSSGDDPENSYFRSKPYLYAFDHSLCFAVYHNEQQRMTDKFLEWGAKKADFRPYGAEHYTYDPNMTIEDIEKQKKDIDIIFIGGAGSRDRMDKILQLKKVFGRRMHIYGNWGGIKGFFGRALRGHGLYQINRISDRDLISTYQRSKIGINMHLSFGPCNLRMYQLPMNGVMQICDNKKGFSEIYDLGKEAVGYDTLDEAIELIRYYLAHDDERKRIAINGYMKAKSTYLFHQSFFETIKSKIIPHLILKK